MNIGSAIAAEALEERTLYLFAALIIVLALVRSLGAAARKRMHGAVVAFILHALLMPIAGVVRATKASLYDEVRFASLAFASLTAIFIVGTFVFEVVAPRIRVRVPRILQDVLIAGTAVVTLFVLASRTAGWNITGVIATSAVLTAVIGLAFQDTLGNILGGLALQMDDSITVGDWIKVGDVSGQVNDIRWRYTAIETRNWETVLLPNSMLVKNEVMVLGRRTGEPVKWRRWVYFNVDFRYAPSDVIDAVIASLSEEHIANVAATPAPNCILMDLHDSYARYAVRYWLDNLAVDDPTDSVIRTRIYFALKRVNIPLSMPAHAVFLTEESTQRRQLKTSQDIAHRMEVLSKVDIFAMISEDERLHLADNLHHAPFAEGERMTKQGAVAHWLYIIIKGDASVRVVSGDGKEREVATLHDGDFFGEMGLLTGERRSATVVALTDVDCYRLERAAFKELLDRRPQIAEQVADVLAKRRVELAVIKENLDEATQRDRLRKTRRDLLSSIRSFFALGDDPRPHVA
jgi:small-conductance mechanosensitive channel